MLMPEAISNSLQRALLLTNGEQIWLSVWKSRRNQFPSITAGLGAPELSSHFSSSAERARTYTRHQAGVLSSQLLSLSLPFRNSPRRIKLLGKLALCECAVCVMRRRSPLSRLYNIMYVDGMGAWLHILLMWKRRAPAKK
jgi:hypothetical protein